MVFYLTKDRQEWVECSENEYWALPKSGRAILWTDEWTPTFVRTATDADEVNALIASLTEV